MRTGAWSQRTAWLLAAAVAALGGVAGAGGPALARPLDEVTASGTLKVAVYRDNPPFSFRRDGTLAGVDVDIGRRIAERMGVAPDFMEVTADETVDDDLRNAVWKGHHLWGKVVADLMLSVPYDRDLGQRNPEVVLFAPYAEERYVLVSDPQRTGATTSLAALRSGGVGVEIDSLPDFFLSAAFNGALAASVVHFPTTEAAARALADGRLSAAMGTRSRLEGALGDRLRALQMQPAGLRGFGKESWTLGIAVKENSRDLGYAAEDAIGELIGNGGMAAIFRAHGLSWRAPTM